MWGVPRTDLAVATITDAAGRSVVYAIGGRNATGYPTPRVMAYDVARNTWTLRAPLPQGLWGMDQAAVLNGKIYVSGGCQFRGCITDAPSASLYVYDPATNTWAGKRAMPFGDEGVYDPAVDDRLDPGGGGVTGVIKGKLYTLTSCVRGIAPYFEDCDPALFFRYNPVTDRWVALPRPKRGHWLAGGVLYDKFYVIGVGDQPTEVYDPVTNRWTDVAGAPKSLLPQGAVNGAYALLGGKLYVTAMGINTETEPWDTVTSTLVYHPLTNRWNTAAPMPNPRRGIAAARVFVSGQARLEVVGGSSPGNNMQYVP